MSTEQPATMMISAILPLKRGVMIGILDLESNTSQHGYRDREDKPHPLTSVLLTSSKLIGGSMSFSE